MSAVFRKQEEIIPMFSTIKESYTPLDDPYFLLDEVVPDSVTQFEQDITQEELLELNEELFPTEILDAREIWDLIFAGKKIEICFQTKNQLENLRVRIHQIKAKSEKESVAIGFMDKDDVQSLIFEKKNGEAPLELTYFISIGKRKREVSKYLCKIYEE